MLPDRFCFGAASSRAVDGRCLMTPPQVAARHAVAIAVAALIVSLSLELGDDIAFRPWQYSLPASGGADLISCPAAGGGLVRLRGTCVATPD